MDKRAADFADHRIETADLVVNYRREGSSPTPKCSPSLRRLRAAKMTPYFDYLREKYGALYRLPPAVSVPRGPAIANG